MDANQSRIIRAEKAARLLEDPIFEEAYQAVYSKYFRKIINSESHEQHVREDGYQRIQALAAVKAELKTFMQDGQLAQHEIAQAKKLRAI